MASDSEKLAGVGYNPFHVGDNLYEEYPSRRRVNNNFCLDAEGDLHLLSHPRALYEAIYREDMSESEKLVLKALLFSGCDEIGVSRYPALRDLMKGSGYWVEDAATVSMEKMTMEDIGKDYGYKRDVYLVTIYLSDGKKMRFTASIDRNWYLSREEFSPSLSEAHLLLTFKHPLYDMGCETLQRYGSAVALGKGGSKGTRASIRQISEMECFRGVVFKEYVPGMMLGKYTYDSPCAEEIFGKDVVEHIAYRTGVAVARTINMTGGIPKDSHHYNLIVSPTDDGDLSVRYCDTEDLVQKHTSVIREINIVRDGLRDQVKRFDQGFLDGMEEGKKDPPVNMDDFYARVNDYYTKWVKGLSSK